MANFTVNNISVVGMAVVVPENKLERDDFVKQFGEDVTTKFIKSTGIKCIHIYIGPSQNKQPVT